MPRTGTQPIEPFELFAIRYANHSGRKASDNFILGDAHETASDLDYFVWVARRGDRSFVIDTGFGEEAAARRKRTLISRPAPLLARFGLDAAHIDDIILTHLHYDHAGTLEDFPRARLHVQDVEVSYATGRCMCHHALNHPYDVENIVHFVRCLYCGRVHFHDGSAELADGLSVHHIGGHSAGLQVVRVWTKRGWVVVASDASHLYANFEEQRPFPVLSSVIEMMEGFRTLHELADSPDHIIPGHDPLVMSRYRAPAPDLEGVVVRLDEAPVK
ncbi:N-acyl homoserine lactonase family protein [Chelativorans sp. SCAU2101]|jgi:glyoxylase-like metal-dependent hydrolase (beta-lactamase superfamily II)|uniref:N-acyl homoserine lactonase family protein n=1 Tax=Chelativorans petroleitrophicus TaxID=2975484 RepID=A0A9X2X5Z9_9HYPH|nr:N-acyl homoserine lactonase family protein [Chelativorans petroleitrophicus]MCT8989064.1 N-acyl homoserine lactonase family protein [Chelativorans petroleitrophicus]